MSVSNVEKHNSLICYVDQLLSTAKRGKWMYKLHKILAVFFFMCDCEYVVVGVAVAQDVEQITY